MNKSQLIQELAARASLSKQEAQVVVDTFFDQISQSLIENDRVEIRGFGSFRVRHKNPRQGRNPRTGESISIDRKAFPHFKPGKDLRGGCEARDEQE
jgi:integration host factor subunit beta